MQKKCNFFSSSWKHCIINTLIEKFHKTNLPKMTLAKLHETLAPLIGTDWDMYVWCVVFLFNIFHNRYHNHHHKIYNSITNKHLFDQIQMQIIAHTLFIKAAAVLQFRGIIKKTCKATSTNNNICIIPLLHILQQICGTS